MSRTHPLILSLALLLVAGCTQPTIEATPYPPDRMSLTLFTTTSTHQITYFELTRAGELRYAGGADATGRQGIPVATLTPQQRQDIWDIMIQGRLHEAPAGPLFPQASQVNYDFTLNTGGIDHIVRAADNELPALRTLHDYLFQIQAARYGE